MTIIQPKIIKTRHMTRIQYQFYLFFLAFSFLPILLQFSVLQQISSLFIRAFQLRASTCGDRELKNVLSFLLSCLVSSLLLLLLQYIILISIFNLHFRPCSPPRQLLSLPKFCLNSANNSTILLPNAVKKLEKKYTRQIKRNTWIGSIKFSLHIFSYNIKIDKENSMQLQLISLKNQISFAQGPNLHEPSQITRVRHSVFKSGEWTNAECLKYFLFIFHNRYKFTSKSIRKSTKIFKRMTKFVKSRSSCQCRTHHQNIIRKFGEVQSALESFIEENPTFYQKYNIARTTLQYLEDQQFLEDNSKVIREPQKQQKAEIKIQTASQENSHESFSEKLPPSTEKQPQRKQVINEIIIQNINQPQYCFQMGGFSGQRNRILVQCHSLFLEWRNKLQRLLQYQRLYNI